MGSPWEFAIPQTMQRHGGSNRSAPKAAQPKAVIAPVLQPDLETAAERADGAGPHGPEAPSTVPDHRRMPRS